MRPELAARARMSRGFPRVSGDAPRAVGTTRTSSMFSPRERG